MDSIRKHGHVNRPEFELSETQTQSKQPEQLQTSATMEVSLDHTKPRADSFDLEPEIRSFDLVIFGATGSVGRFVVEELALVLAKNYSQNNKEDNCDKRQQNQNCISNELDPNRMVRAQTQRRHSVPRHISNGVRWAVAGRSSVRLNETLCRAELYTGTKDLSSRIPMLLADLNHQRSLIKMCSRTNLVINCAGPFAADSEALVKACLKTKTHYIDLCHETAFIEQIRQKYSEQARQSGVYIINGCGFQSMSAEIGLNFTKQVVDGRIDEVKIILNLSDSSARIRPKGRQLSGTNFQFSHCGIVTRGMWQSLLIDKAQKISMRANKAIAALDETKDDCIAYSGETTEMKRPLLRKDTQSLVRDIVEFHNRHSLVWLDLFKGFGETGQGYCLPINSLTGDEAQLVRGEMANYELRKPDVDSLTGWRPIKCTSFVSFKNFKQIVVALIWVLLFNLLIKFPHIRTLMGWFPFISSLGHVKTTRRALDRTSLSHIKYSQTFLAYGVPSDGAGDPLNQIDHPEQKRSQLLVSRVVGPEPNHVATATFVVQAALALVTERDHLTNEAGVMTPGVAFAETNIIYQLRRRNIKFEVMKKL